ncbi:MAG: CHAD domain-containing protein [Roseomonas sp.]|nr:CHAD domain-containing protein [Roseomonas sp.]MCA3381468.1 CHAD domain-containing protein [Roseomonas sp.]
MSPEGREGGGEVAEPAPEPPLSLEFVLPVADAARLARFPILAALRQGRISTSTEKLRWLDTRSGALAAEGRLIEAPKRGLHRMIALAPGSEEPWHPGHILPPVAVLAPHETPEAAKTEALTPLAAFSGKRRSQRLLIGDALVGLSLIQGHLRAVAAERELARVFLSGPAPAVLDLAQRLTTALPLLPPSQSLGAEALSLATARALEPRRRGAPDTSKATSAEACFTLAIGHLLEVALHYAPMARAGLDIEGVHQLRVALRRLRSVLKVFRPITGCKQGRALDGALKELLGLLGPARDWDVFLAGIGADLAGLLPEDHRLHALLEAAGAERQAAYQALANALDGPGWRQVQVAGIAFLHEKPWRAGAEAARLGWLDGPPREFAAHVLEKRWRKLCDDGAEIETLPPEALHALRLDAKRLRYAAEVFAPVFPHKAARRFQRRLAALQEELGRSNDAAVARALVQRLARAGDDGRLWAIGAAEGWCLARSVADRNAILNAWEKLTAKESFWSGD